MSWLVEDGETGLVTPTNDVDGLTDSLCRLRDDPAFAIRLGLKGRQKFLATLTVNASAEAIQDLYHHLTSTP